MIIDVIKRGFFKPNWKLAYREVTEEDVAMLRVDIKREYNVFTSNGKCWYADPFIICECNRTYVFCECYLNEKNKGVIAVGEYKNGRINGMKTIIEQDYHMSYPCIFKYESSYYMIPETSDNKTIELYQANQFPNDWRLIKTLKKDIKCVDLTVFSKDDELLVIGYILERKKNKVCVFHLDMEHQVLTTIDTIEAVNTGRGAGNICYLDGKIIRPTQICKKKYGESIAFKEIVSTRKGAYHEKVLSKLQGRDILVKGEKKIDRLHTFNRRGNVEIIDYSHDTFDLVRPVRVLLSRLK